MSIFRKSGRFGAALVGVYPAAVGSAAFAQDAYEPDNTARTAKPIASGVAQNRTIHQAGDADLAKFTVDGDGAHNVQVTASDGTQLWLIRGGDGRDHYERDNVRVSAKIVRNGRTQRRNIPAAGDTQMGLYDRAGTRLRFDDDRGPGRFSRITVPSISPGTNYLRIQEKENNRAIPLYSLKIRWTAR